MKDIKQRWKNVETIKNLFNLDADMLEVSIGNKGNDFNSYTDEELAIFADFSQEQDDKLTQEFMFKSEKMLSIRGR